MAFLGRRMQLTKAAITQSNGGPSPTRTQSPYPCLANLPGPFPDTLPRHRNAFRRDIAALSRHTDARKDKAETLTGYIGALKSDVEALSRDLGAEKINAGAKKDNVFTQKGNADAEKSNADVQKDNAEAEKTNADAEKFNVFARQKTPNDLISSSLHSSSNQHPESGIQQPVSSN